MKPQSSLANWQTQSRKGFLDLCILNCLSQREYYGYDLVQTLKQFDGSTIRTHLGGATADAAFARNLKEGAVENAKLLGRINSVMRRVKLPAVPESILDWLPEAREQVGRRQVALMTPE